MHAELATVSCQIGQDRWSGVGQVVSPDCARLNQLTLVIATTYYTHTPTLLGALGLLAPCVSKDLLSVLSTCTRRVGTFTTSLESLKVHVVLQGSHQRSFLDHRGQLANKGFKDVGPHQQCPELTAP